MRNPVVQPQDWDERGKGVKTDRIDALALCQRLDRYVRGNRKAFSVVRVPSEDEERERAFSRQRQQLMRERQRLQAMGRSLLAMHGIHVTGKWWRGKTWATIASEAPEWVIERLRIFIRLIEPVEAEERKLTEAIKEAARDRRIPKGVGPLSFEVLRREVGDWSRFNNYPALCARSAVRLRRFLKPRSRPGQWRQVSSYCSATPHGAHPFGAACGWLSRSARLRAVPAGIEPRAGGEMDGAKRSPEGARTSGARASTQ